MSGPITEIELEGAERWLAETLKHCASLRRCQKHRDAKNCALGAIGFMRVLSETGHKHGFFHQFIVDPYAGKFEEFC